MSKSYLPLLLVSGLVLACGENPVANDAAEEPILTAASAAALPPGWEARSLSILDDCNGETVAIESRFLRRFVVTPAPQGGVHINFHWSEIGTGVGETTGTEYNYTSADNRDRKRFDLPATFTIALSRHLISKGSADNRLFHATLHITVNANGDETVNFLDTSVECVG